MITTTTDTPLQTVYNYVDGAWIEVKKGESLPVINPATQEILSYVPLTSKLEVGRTVTAARTAADEWGRMPALERIQYLFGLKNLLERDLDGLARQITLECGKTYAESVAEMQRAIENVEVACGIPILLQGEVSEDIAPGIDEMMLRQPLGVTAAVLPFNFPGMILFWFMPYAVACGNTMVVKPSEKTPLTMQWIFRLIEEAGFPKGVLSMVNGARETVDALLDHPDVASLSFVGSTPVAHYLYSRAAANGKRAQCQGGAKNPVVVMPDADMETTTRIIADSAFGCAGQRCLAAATVITVGSAREIFTEQICQAARERTVGFGLDKGVQMGPVITSQSRQRIEELVGLGIKEGASLLVDGRNASIAGYEKGNFIRPTILGDVPHGGVLSQTEIFGPVLSLCQVESLDDAIWQVNDNQFGNAASIFTSVGAHARQFRNQAGVGNVGVNIGVAAPMAFFPFSGWKNSFYGDLHGQSKDAVDFFTQKKVVVERWPRDWSRKF